MEQPKQQSEQKKPDPGASGIFQKSISRIKGSPNLQSATEKLEDMDRVQQLREVIEKVDLSPAARAQVEPFLQDLKQEMDVSIESWVEEFDNPLALLSNITQFEQKFEGLIMGVFDRAGSKYQPLYNELLKSEGIESVFSGAQKPSVSTGETSSVAPAQNVSNDPNIRTCLKVKPDELRDAKLRAAGADLEASNVESGDIVLLEHPPLAALFNRIYGMVQIAMITARQEKGTEA